MPAGHRDSNYGARSCEIGGGLLALAAPAAILVPGQLQTSVLLASSEWLAILALAIWQDRRLEPLAVGEDESIYPEIVHRFNFPKDAIVMSGQFTGAYLYYTGRDCIRWDQLDNDRFQLLRAYVTNANLRWYAVLTPYEWEQVQKFNASWTKLDEHRGVLFLRLAGD